ncbi:TRAP transporter small permease [Bordetella pertussis]
MYSFIWLSWFAMARHCRYGTNLGFTKIRNSLPAPVRRVLEVIDAILWLAIGAVVFWSTAELISSNFVTEQMVMSTPIPAWIINLGYPGLGLFNVENCSAVMAGSVSVGLS